MFRIGDFSKIARVSGRLLRYYDSIGLLSPKRIDPSTGYRHYEAGQLARLNKILALKELGLSLDQVARMLDGDISAEEIRGMFLLKKAELERALAEEAQRLRNVEARLAELDEGGGASGELDVLAKTVAAQPFLAYRQSFSDFPSALAAIEEVSRHAGRRIPNRKRGPLTVVAHADFEEDHLDLELGFALTDDDIREIALPSLARLALAELPEEPLVASTIRAGPVRDSHIAYAALGRWMEANRCEIAGPCREVFLKGPFEPPDPGSGVVEIQFPIRRI